MHQIVAPCEGPNKNDDVSSHPTFCLSHFCYFDLTRNILVAFLSYFDFIQKYIFEMLKLKNITPSVTIYIRFFKFYDSNLSLIIIFLYIFL